MQYERLRCRAPVHLAVLRAPREGKELPRHHGAAFCEQPRDVGAKGANHAARLSKLHLYHSFELTVDGVIRFRYHTFGKVTTTNAKDRTDNA